MKVTDVLKEILIAQQRRLIDGGEAVRRILGEVERQILADLVTTPAESFAAWRLQQSLTVIESHLQRFETDAKATIGTGIAEAWDAGAGLLPAMADSAGMVVGRLWVSSHTLDSLKEFAWGKITAVRTDAVARIRGELTLGILGQKTPQQVAAEIAGSLERPGIFKSIAARAEVITKTEMGRAFSMATEASIDNAAVTLPDLEKMWLHAGHPKRPRIWHLKQHGQIVPAGEKFLIGNIGMRYPRDPLAPASEVIGCGCTHVPYMRAWGTKKEFLRSWDQAQKTANQRKGG